MSEREPLTDLLGGIVPFLKGVVIGSVVTGWLVCFGWHTYIVAVADIPSGAFDAFLVWILFGIPAFTITATVWLAAMLSVAWLVSPWPLVLRSSQFVVALGAIVACSAALAGPLDRQFNLGRLIEVLAPLPMAVAPFLMLRRGSGNRTVGHAAKG